MIKALIFDCFGVLYRDNISILYDVIPAEKRQAMRDIIHATDHGILSRSEYFEQIAELAGKTADDICAIENKQFVRNDILFARVEQYKKQYVVGLLSNIGDETMDRLFSAAEQAMFDAFVLSSDVGIIKPAVEIFEYAALKLGLDPSECVMIDDRIENCEGARMAGMEAVLYTSLNDMESELSQLGVVLHA